MTIRRTAGLGLALAMSSTALVLRITDMRTPVGRGALAMLLFEDIALVPIIFLLGALAPFTANDGMDGLLQTLLLGLVVILGLLIIGRYLLPLLFAQAARTKSPELFLAASLLVVILAALATAGVGLSPIVGALIGTLGGFVLGLPGLLFGPFAGAVAGELLSHGEMQRATRAGFATWVGLIFGTLFKLALVFTMLGVFAFAWFV